MTRNHPLPTKNVYYNSYAYEPEGDPALDTPKWEALVAAVNSYTPVNKSSKIIIRDNAKSMILSSLNSTADTSEFLKGCFVEGETPSSRIQYNDGYIINWGRYGNPIRTSDTYSWFTCGTMSAMPRWSSLVSGSSITLAKGDYVLVWSDDDIPFEEVAPHDVGAFRWSVSMTGTGGTYTLNVNGNTTAAINWNDDIATVTSKVQAAAGTGPTGAQNALVSGSTGASYVLSMSGALAKPSPAKTLTAGTGSLTGGTVTITQVAIGKQRPAQLHRVNHEDAGGWVLDGFLVDPLTTNPKICKIDMLRGCGMRNLTFGSNGVDTSDPNAPQLSCVSIQRCHNFVMEDVFVDDTGSGAVNVQLCGDSVINNFSGVWQFNNRRTYAVTIGVCHNVIYQDSVWHNTRHIITSNGLQVTAGDGIRYGTAIGCAGRNLTNYISGDVLDTAFASMDLHAESWGFELEDCRVYNTMHWDGGAEECFGFSTRARNTRLINCRFFSAMTQTVPVGPTWFEGYYGSVATGLRLMGNDCYVKNFYQDRGWRGIWIRPEITSTGFAPQRAKIEGGTFENITGPAIYQQESDTDECNGIEVLYNTFRNCGARYFPAGSPSWPGAAIRLRRGTGHKVRFNNIDKTNNYYTMDLDTRAITDCDVYGNVMRGYGSGRMGLRGDAGDPKSDVTTSGPAFHTAYASKNYVDP